MISKITLWLILILSCQITLGQPELGWDASHGCMTNANERQWSIPYHNSKVATVAVVFTKTNGTSFGRCTGTFKINFDRGYEWFLSPDVGYLALYDKAGLFYPKDHDTLTLKTYH